MYVEMTRRIFTVAVVAILFAASACSGQRCSPRSDAHGDLARGIAGRYELRSKQSSAFSLSILELSLRQDGWFHLLELDAYMTEPGKVNFGRWTSAGDTVILKPYRLSAGVMVPEEREPAFVVDVTPTGLRFQGSTDPKPDFYRVR